MNRIITLAVLMYSLCISAQVNEPAKADTLTTYNLDDITVSAVKQGTLQMPGAENTLQINQAELFRAACCNLGESFVTNPSVDINNSDAATGAKQIRLLGLSGTYVQMLTENMPNLRGAAAPYSLDLVPGPWMQSIQVSKGCSSVRNGYESITGQINIEYLKPDDEQGLLLNLYGNTLSRYEANGMGNIQLSPRLHTELLVHYQDDKGHHDENHDGFLDQPNVRQVNIQNRWKLKQDRYLFHAGIGLVTEDRDGGQTQHTMPQMHELFNMDIATDRYEAYMKHAFIINPDKGTNIALMMNGAIHTVDAVYGHKLYDVNQKNAYAQLLFETNFTELHNLSAGLSFSHDYLKENPLELVTTDEGTHYEPMQLPMALLQPQKETTPGMYAQYTYNLHGMFIAMAGIRADHSSLYGTFITPRFHLKYIPNNVVSIRLSAGKGYRTVRPLAENHYLLASGRQLVIDPLEQENAWNYGITAALYIPLFGNTMKVNAEYYRTDFGNQAVIDYETDFNKILITNLRGDSYSNTFQVDATYPVTDGLEIMAAYRINDVKTTYGGRLMRKPLTSKYKGLLTVTYKSPLELWQADMTLQINGGGRMPTPYTMADGSLAWPEKYHAFGQLSAQVTRWFRHFSVYVGAENITGYRQHQTIISANDAWSNRFDPTMVWGPVHGAVAYAGIRLNIGRTW